MKISVTLNLQENEMQGFESWIRYYADVIDFRVLPDTKKLYERSSHFKELIKKKKDLGLEIDRYINEHNI